MDPAILNVHINPIFKPARPLQIMPGSGKENQRPPNAFREAKQILKGHLMHTPERLGPAANSCSPGRGLFEHYICGSSGSLLVLK